MKNQLLTNTSFSKNLLLAPLFFGIFLLISGCDEDDPKAQWKIEVDELKTSMESYTSIDYAKADGYDVDATGHVEQMGHHFIKGSLIDDKFELNKPESLLYKIDDNGNAQFVGVEYLVIIPDINNPPPAPEGFTGDNDVWEINTEASLWTLHAWIRLENPNGVFAAYNPNL